jgi:hypothetical protein
VVSRLDGVAVHVTADPRDDVALARAALEHAVAVAVDEGRL